MVVVVTFQPLQPFLLSFYLFCTEYLLLVNYYYCHYCCCYYYTAPLLPQLFFSLPPYFFNPISIRLCYCMYGKPPFLLLRLPTGRSRCWAHLGVQTSSSTISLDQLGSASIAKNAIPKWKIQLPSWCGVFRFSLFVRSRLCGASPLQNPKSI